MTRRCADRGLGRVLAVFPADQLDTAALPATRGRSGDDVAKSRGEELVEQLQYGVIRKPIAERDLVDVDVAPWSLLLVDDLEVGLLAAILAHIPERRLEPFVIATGDRLNGFPVDHEAKLGRRADPSADQESNEISLDREWLADQAAGGVVPLEERIDQALAFEATDGLLARQSARGRSWSERFALDLPVRITALEVFEHDVGADSARAPAACHRSPRHSSSAGACCDPRIPGSRRP